MAIGLDDVIAAETILSDVDGLAGRLIIRGHSLETLAGRSRYEDVVALLFDGFFPEKLAGDDLRPALAAARRDVFDRMLPLAPTLAAFPLYDGMRGGMALLPDGEGIADALRLIAGPAILVPLLLRTKLGQNPITPDPQLHHAADIVHMLGHDRDAESLVHALDTYLVTVCDHGLNASTFAARVVASTQAGLTSAALAGLGALKGPLHGGAPGPVLAMIDAIAADGDARSYLEHQLSTGARLMGFGHRIYRVRDPRADALKVAVEALGHTPAAGERLALAEQIERTALEVLRRAKPGRIIQTNVEFYTALLLEAVGFPPESFTGVFAMGRIAGWIAHAREQQLTGRLIRPQSRYVGPGIDIAA